MSTSGPRQEEASLPILWLLDGEEQHFEQTPKGTTQSSKRDGTVEKKPQERNEPADQLILIPDTF